MMMLLLMMMFSLIIITNNVTLILAMILMRYCLRGCRRLLSRIVSTTISHDWCWNWWSALRFWRLRRNILRVIRNCDDVWRKRTLMHISRRVRWNVLWLIHTRTTHWHVVLIIGWTIRSITRRLRMTGTSLWWLVILLGRLMVVPWNGSWSIYWLTAWTFRYVIRPLVS